MSQNQLQSGTSAAIPVNEVYWSLVAKADKKFSKIRNLPYYQRTRYDTYFYKVFKVYTELWKFQQENRQKLVEGGLKRWEIGEIASRIGHLYFGQYMRASEASYLSECYIFYEAILTREYFKDGMHQDLNLASKQLRFLARFLTVCLVLNRREIVYQLLNQLKVFLDECRRTFQETDFKEWKLVLQDIAKFLKEDTAFLNIRPLRYSVVLDLHPDHIPQVTSAKKKLRLRDALLCSYRINEVKFSELNLDTLRMLQCLEWEPSGSFYQLNIPSSSGTGSSSSQNGSSGSSRVNRDITDHTLPPNPRKAILSRPSATRFLAVLGSICEELPSDGVLLIYISASGYNVHDQSSPFENENSIDSIDNMNRDFEFRLTNIDCGPTSVTVNEYDTATNSGSTANCLVIAPPHGQSGTNCIYPSDILPFTRRPLFLIIDSENSKGFMKISGSEKGEHAALLLSPTKSLPFPNSESLRQSSGSLFTSFLTAPLQTFILFLGFGGSDTEELYRKTENLFQSLLMKCGLSLALSDDLDPVWSQVLTDPFLRRLLLRFIFCRSLLSLYNPSSGKMEYQPECLPALPEVASPMSISCQRMVFQLASVLGVTERFTFSETAMHPEDGETISLGNLQLVP